MSGWWFWLVRYSRRLLARASAYGVFAVVAALAADWFAPFVPEQMSERLGGPAVENILSVLASSLLAVTTFSVSVVVVAYTAAAGQLTPRAAPFITNDSATQRTLATFVGAFLFAVVALVALGAGYYGSAGRSILFLATLAMVALVAVTLLGWIDQTSRLAQHDHLLEQIEQATRRALQTQIEKPFLGGLELKTPSETGAALVTHKIGYLANVDPHSLQSIAAELDCTVEVLASPGDFVRRGEPLLRLPKLQTIDDDLSERLRAAFAFSKTRTFEQDPRYGLQVLAEAAARALSAGVNDPGTAVLAADASYRLLALWAEDEAGAKSEPTCPRIRARGLDACELIRLSLGEISYYGAKDPMVAACVQASLAALAKLDGGVAACARREGELALKRAEAAIALEPDLERVRAAARG